MIFAELRELRATRPEAVADLAARRARRPLLGADGKLMIVAADHPARGALGVRDVPDAMADRYDLLRRLVIALSRPGVDGVLGTSDILEDLLLLGALEDKVVIGSMNRGGLQGAVFELDDRFTGYDAGTIAAMGFDGGKMLTRIDLSDLGSVATLEASGRAVTELAARGLMAMVEPFWSRRVDGRVVNDLTARRSGQVGRDRERVGRFQRVHVAEAAGGRGHGHGDGRDDAADAVARRRSQRSSGRNLCAVGRCARTARRARPGRRAARCSIRPTATSARPSMSRCPC